MVDSALINGPLFPQQVYILPLAVHARNIERSMPQISGPIQDTVSLFESGEVEWDVR
jgi:hypothetical protein